MHFISGTLNSRLYILIVSSECGFGWLRIVGGCFFNCMLTLSTKNKAKYQNGIHFSFITISWHSVSFALLCQTEYSFAPLQFLYKCSLGTLNIPYVMHLHSKSICRNWLHANGILPCLPSAHNWSGISTQFLSIDCSINIMIGIMYTSLQNRNIQF